MSLQDFIALWQAQPFRPFRIHTARGIFEVNHPLGVALSPRMHVLVVVDNARAEDLALDEMERCEVHGEPVTLAEAVGAIPPDTLARNAEILAQALQAGGPIAEKKRKPAFDPGSVTFLGAHASDGVFLVHATLSNRDGQPIFSTAGTRWNLHGTERFENGTSLYLHHRDHPTVEQRMIIWPPDTGSFESFAEAKSLAELTNDLKKRDQRLAAKPARTQEPPAAHFRKIVPVYKVVEPDGYEEAFGPSPTPADLDRFELHLVPRKIESGRDVKNPCLVDVPSGEFLFNLTETDWDATFKRGEWTIALSLRYAGRGKSELKVNVNPLEHTARVEADETDLPLGFVERHLRNYALYEPWDVMLAALRAGPVKRKQPDIVLPLAAGFRAELWVGESDVPLPFLQPRFLDPKGRTLLDLRATAWGASVSADPTQPRVTLRFVSHEEKKRFASPRFELQLDLMTHRVTCRGLKGSTTIGMIQAMVRRVRGVKWLAEDLPTWFAKGRLLPLT